METKRKNSGSVLLMTVLVIAFLSALVSGILHVNTEEIQLMRNQIFAAEALAVSEAGLNDAFSMLRSDCGWGDGFSGKSFNRGSYTVTVSGSLPNLTIRSVGTSAQNYTARMEADITVSDDSPYIIRIDNLRINE